MKIAVFTNTYVPHVGGVANSVLALVDGMRRRNHQVLVIAPEFSEQPDNEEQVVRVPAIKDFQGSGFSFRLPSGSLIGDAIRAFKPDIIHSHHPFLLGDTAVRLAVEGDVFLVFTHHTRYEDYAHYVVEDSELIESLASEMATEYANLCDCVIAPSESLEELIKSRGVQVPVQVIPTGIEQSRFADGDGKALRKKLGLKPESWVVGHLGRLAPEKNVEYLLKAVFSYLEQDEDSAFLVVGSGESLESMKKLSGESKVSDRIHFIGKLSGQDLVDAYHAMDIFAFSSKSETQGMVLAEAMAAGLPVVALDASGVREIVVDGQNGRLLPESASPADFAKALAQMRERLRSDTQDMKDSLLKTAHRFSESVCLDKVENLYLKLIADEPGLRNLDPWTRFTNRLEAEWDLAAGRARAVKAAIKTVSGQR